MKAQINLCERPSQTTENCKIGDMFLVNDKTCINSDGCILLRTYDAFVNLQSPKSTYQTNCGLWGRKLLPGESVTLIQE